MIGTTELTFSRGGGVFHCPGCLTRRPYRRKVVRQFVTVYFIPLIPLVQIREYIVCDHCKTKYGPATVHLTPEAVEQMRRRKNFESIRRALVLIVAADDVVTEEELETIRAFSRKFLQTDISAQQILAEAARAQQGRFDAVDYIRQTALEFDVEDRRTLVHYAFLAATAAGRLSRSRRQLLAALPRAVGMPESEYRAVIQRAVES